MELDDESLTKGLLTAAAGCAMETGDAIEVVADLIPNVIGTFEAETEDGATSNIAEAAGKGVAVVTGEETTIAALTGLIPNWNNGFAAAVAVDASPVFPEPDATASLPGLAV